MITVKAKFIEAQIIETMLLVTVNHQSLIATKAHRVVQEAKGRPVMEFGARRAQGYDSATYGARAAYIGGVAGTATVSAGEMFDIPVVGTMAHSFVQSFDRGSVESDCKCEHGGLHKIFVQDRPKVFRGSDCSQDRKSTRLNSSHPK